METKPDPSCQRLPLPNVKCDFPQARLGFEQNVASQTDLERISRCADFLEVYRAEKHRAPLKIEGTSRVTGIRKATLFGIKKETNK
jgi:hypothetical protein